MSENKKLGQEPMHTSSKRFVAACAAMQGLLSNADYIRSLDRIGLTTEEMNETISKSAFILADELLKHEGI